MLKFNRDTLRSRTFWIGLLTALGGVGAGLSGQVDWGTAAQAIVGGLMAATLRDAISKGPGA